MRRPRIGMNVDVREDEKGITFYHRSKYTRAIWKAGGMPVLLAPLMDADLEEVLHGLKGLLLTGGDDLDPVHYGGVERMPEEVPLHPLREEFDLKLVKAAVRMRLPLLAVCLGIQELCVAFGGTLHPFIPDCVPGALPHQGDGGSETTHPIQVEPETRLAGILGTRSLVNSSHRQAVKQPGSGLVVAARSADGVIEAVEGEGDFLLIGVQWHPETMTEEQDQLMLFEALVDASRH